MPTKPEIILKRIEDSLSDPQAKLCLEFNDWLENEQDTSERNWLNYFKVLVLFSDHIGFENHSIRETIKESVKLFYDK